jgi:CubicO group peptidase (beta-lactamase class C family)
MKYSLFIFLIVILFPACSNEPSTENLNDKIKQVESNLINPVYIEGDATWTIEERMAHYGVPGLSIAVIYDGYIEFVKTYGVMDKESKSPVTEATLFQAGSISKPVAAYGALKLVEQNKILLEEDIHTYLTSWKLPDSEFTKEKKVTLKNLLNHSGGITVHGFLGYRPDLPVPTLVEVLNGTPPANSGAIFVDKFPEESFRYSGGGYTVMQQMMMDIEGKGFPQLMRDLVLKPLEMNNSTYDQPLQSAQLELAATGYLPDGQMTKGKRHTYPEMAAAGLWTTAEDLAKFTVNIQKSLKGESELILSQSMTASMLTPFVEDFTGLGFFINKRKEEIYFGHGGWDEGFSSELIAHKDKGYGVVILTNSNHPEFIHELIRSVALTYKWDEYVPHFKKLDLNPNDAEKIVGRYRMNDENTVQIYLTKNQLFKRNLGEEPFELVKISDTSFVSRDDDERTIQFIINPENGNYDMFIRNQSGILASSWTRMEENEKIPLEFLENGEFEKALKAYQALANKNPINPAVTENNLNELGYRFLNLTNTKLARDIFKVNLFLYPKSSNVYDSYAEACMKMGDLDLALENYKKSLSLDPLNNNAKIMINEMSKRKDI